jgi:colanic acid/amylovoran biosynthesis glycosyltransferase
VTGPRRDLRTRVIYITAQLPYGATEPFLIGEIAELERQGCDVTIVPVRPKGNVVHSDAAELLPKAACLPLLSGAILRSAVAEAARSPAAVVRALLSLRRSRNARILLKNLAVFPKALWLARYARRLGAHHLHAHWAGTSATLAMVASQVAGISWSLTTHRWDIPENNLLRLKARRACFVRAISARGADELRVIVDERSWSPWLLHMGVRLPPAPARQRGDPPFRVLTAASLIEVKGHACLIDAVRRLKESDVSVRAELAGDGPLEASLRSRVRELGLEDEVVFLGRVSHEQLVREMAGGKWDAAVLPSIIPTSGAQEGIPVFLMEAMACGLPAIGTESGAVPELLGEGAGVLVAPGDPDALAQALEKIAADPARRTTLAERGRKRIEEAFSVAEIASALHSRFRECSTTSLS